VSAQAPTQARRPVHEAQVGGEKVARSRSFEWLARSGFVARGLIYGIIGILAIKLAIGVGGTTTNQQGALKTIAHQPFGKVLLILVAIGLAGYALWRLLHALLGHGPEDSDSGFERIAALDQRKASRDRAILPQESRAPPSPNIAPAVQA
jgi:fumarate reductase subunit D